MESLLLTLVLAVLAVPVLLVAALVQIAGLKRRVATLEARVGSSSTATPATPATAAASTPGATATQASPRPVPEPPPVPPPSRAVPARAPQAGDIAASPAAPRTAAPASTPAAAPAARPTSAAPPAPRSPSLVDTGTRLVRRWFTEGNVPVKVGMLVLFAGVAALLKYASDQGWMTLPLELRLAAIALAAVAGLVLGWHQRSRRRSFALSLQGGAVGVLLMTVFSAFRVFELLPAAGAFAISVVLVAGTGVLAVLQNARALAILAILAGFLAPVLVSTGEGSHVALFGYYALLNLGILAIAWYRPWRVLNLLGFAFTFGIGTAWGVLAYRPEHLASTLPFLGLFFALYLLIPLLYARRRGARRRDLVDGCLVFATPLVSFALLAALLDGDRYPLALAALGLGALYAALAWWLLREQRYRPLAESWAVLAAGFATLAVPLALSARVTAGIFALEGAALVWLGLRQGQRLPLWSGIGLQALAGGILLVVLVLMSSFGHAALDTPIANPAFMGALLLALSGLASARSAHHAARPRLAQVLYLWGLAWWLFAAAFEIDRHLSGVDRPAAWLAWVSITLAALTVALGRSRFPALSPTAAAAFGAALFIALAQSSPSGHPFAGHAAWGWLAFLATGMLALRALRLHPGPAVTCSLGLWLSVWPLVIGLALNHLSLRTGLGAGWHALALVAPWLLVSAGVLLAPDRIGVPLQQAKARWQPPLATLFQAIGVVALAILLLHPGDSAPLPFVPLINPVELATLAALALLARWLFAGPAPDDLRQRRFTVLAIALFASLSAFTLRGVHQIGGVAWNEDLWRTALGQSSLTLLWSVLGVAAWIVGSRRGQRSVWLAGALLMGVVLLKLVLIDRQHLGNLAGIASFIGYGLLCTAVGYFAPAPPRAQMPAASSDRENP